MDQPILICTYIKPQAPFFFSNSSIYLLRFVMVASLATQSLHVCNDDSDTYFSGQVIRSITETQYLAYLNQSAVGDVAISGNVARVRTLLDAQLSCHLLLPDMFLLAYGFYVIQNVFHNYNRRIASLSCFFSSYPTGRRRPGQRAKQCRCPMGHIPHLLLGRSLVRG